ncbi:MAG: GntR family transcriptional regulator [Zetaproteobacteria bacterium]|nr:GntR family transcriptional regulator [Zetaproteobacteria bacterium]
MERFKRSVHPQERHRTLRERIVDFVKEAIIKGRLRPGERIPEPELAERFGVSRTPIREAFRQLESEGFLTVIPRKGAVVSPITDKDVREFYTIKSLLEGFAARSACTSTHFTAGDIKRMEGLNGQMARLAGKDDFKGFFKLDNQFHDIFLRACGNDKLCSLLNNLVQQFERFRRTSLSQPGRMKNSVKQHDDIIGAFKKRDAALVDKLVRANAERGGEVLVQKILEEQVQ